MKTERAFVYIIRCEDDSLYTGITKDVDKRFETHFLKKKGRGKIYQKPSGQIHRSRLQSFIL